MFDIIGEGYIIDCNYLIEVPYCNYPRPKPKYVEEDIPIISIDIGNMQ